MTATLQDRHTEIYDSEVKQERLKEIMIHRKLKLLHIPMVSTKKNALKKSFSPTSREKSSEVKSKVFEEDIYVSKVDVIAFSCRVTAAKQIKNNSL